MTTKTFELTIDERELMCRMLRYCMENNADCNMMFNGVWYHGEAQRDQEDMKALHDKLKVITVTKTGWVRSKDIWHAAPGNPDLFQPITWEEFE